ncbi:MAG: magnesium-translocating P-type ATPase [Clostridia bacterium]
MKKIIKNEKLKAELARKKEVAERLNFAAQSEDTAIFARLNSGESGISDGIIEESRELYGDNTITHGKKNSLFSRIKNAFINPFTAILFLLAAVSAFTDIIFAAPGEVDPTVVIIISTMVLISGGLRFVQETRSGNAAAKLSDMIRTTTCVEREGEKMEIPLGEVVVGDIVHLSAGDMIPADIRILSAKDIFVSQSALTGESEPVEKTSQLAREKSGTTEYKNLAFMGSNVISGSAKGIVIAVGNDAIMGEIAKALVKKPIKTSFEKGVNSVSWVLIRFMLVMVPIVFFINGVTKGDWMGAVLFAISVAVGLTPEMLSMIVTTCLAKGAISMSRKKVIIKNLNSIQNLGSIDVLCTDKTGTLTLDKVVLEYHLDVNGKENDRVLRHAFLNSNYQTGLKNLMDLAIIEHTNELGYGREISDKYIKVDEIPFDFERRRMSVVVEDKAGKTQMVTKGAVEEMLKISSFVEYNGSVEPLTRALREVVMKKADELGDGGMRVIAVAQKTNPSPVGAFSIADEADMVLIGYLAFLDPPKETAAIALSVLNEHGVSVKVLTGDNERVTRCICQQVGLSVKKILLGIDIEEMSDAVLTKAAEETTVFAKLSPAQKARVVTLLRANGHSVGYMGDGINDAAAMKASDVGISVDTAVDIAKESADVILLEKDLTVLEIGIIEGRKTYANMIKYIKMTASSNFGNMLSVMVASAFLPFLPMSAIHLILLSLIYDISCIAIPWDNVDKEFLKKPRKWDASSIGRFMLFIGPASSVFDITTYLLMFFVICPGVCGGAGYNEISDPALRATFIAVFQAGWFVESMWSQSLVIHMIRTPKIPFIKSHASAPVLFATLSGAVLLTAIPFTPLGAAIGLAPLPGIYFAFLAATILCYMALATVLKRLYIRRYGELL